MQTPEPLHAARLAALEGAVLALFREAQGDGVDALTVSAEALEGQCVIDVTYTTGGQPTAGFSL